MTARKSKNLGFTLIEILVVVSILAILGALVVPKIMDRPNEARVVAAKHPLRIVRARRAAIGSKLRRLQSSTVLW